MQLHVSRASIFFISSDKQEKTKDTPRYELEFKFELRFDQTGGSTVDSPTRVSQCVAVFEEGCT